MIYDLARHSSARSGNRSLVATLSAAGRAQGFPGYARAHDVPDINSNFGARTTPSDVSPGVVSTVLPTKPDDFYCHDQYMGCVGA